MDTILKSKEPSDRRFRDYFMFSQEVSHIKKFRALQKAIFKIAAKRRSKAEMKELTQAM